MTRFRKQYDPTIKVGLDASHDGMTDPSFAEECDINNIMARYMAGQGFPENLKKPTFDDFFEAPDFLQAQQIVLEATTQFEALPSSLRERLNHDPARFLEYLKDPINQAEARKLGLLKTPPPAPPAPPAEPPKETK